MEHDSLVIIFKLSIGFDIFIAVSEKCIGNLRKLLIQALCRAGGRFLSKGLYEQMDMFFFSVN